MSDSFSETTRLSWFSRIRNALGGITTGFVLIAAACAALFWNEGRAVTTARALTEGAAAVISVDAAKVDPANDGKLVHISGPVQVTAAPVDPLFGSLALPANAIRVTRKVEMYQWKQVAKSETRKQLGGSEETVTTYSYEKEWSDKRHDSSEFKQPAGHINPQLRVPQNTATAKAAQLGGFSFAGETLAGLGKPEPVRPGDAAIGDLRQGTGETGAAKIMQDTVYVGYNPAYPAVGDLKISFTAEVTGDASVVGVQRGDSLKSYRASNGKQVFLTRAGEVAADEMFAKAQDDNASLTWLLRGAGILAMFIGFRMLVSIIGVIGDVVPVVGDVFRFATGFASLALTLVLASLVIGIAWVAFRPLVGLAILVTGLGAAAAFLYLGKGKVPAEAAGRAGA